MPEKEPEELSPRQKLLRELIRLRDEYSSEIPDKIVGSKDEQGYKVRKAWFNFVSGNLELAMMQGLVSQELAQKTEQFAEKYCESDFGERLTTKQDIYEADVLLNEAIEELEGES
jgi:hypothetical protein